MSSSSITIARPYAKALFEHALSEKKLALWSDILMNLVQAVLSPKAEGFINNPAATVEQKIDLLLTVCGKNSKENDSLVNFVSLLAKNKRLLILPDIQVLFEQLRAEQEKTIEVDVISFSDVSKAQQEQLTKSLSQRLQREVSLNISIDPSLLGGAIIKAGDLVIDGSVRGKLRKLSTVLAA